MQMINENELILKPTTVEDLEHLFQFQLNEEAIYLAAFTPKDPTNKAAYIEKYTKHLTDPTNNTQTIWLDDTIIGSIAKFIMFGDAEITYWIDRQYWGKGIASKTLQQFLDIERTRPVFGRVAFDNIGSQKVLQKAGFKRIGQDKGFANARQAEIEEFIYKLE